MLALPPFGVAAAGLACWIPLFALVATQTGPRAGFVGGCYGFVIAAYVFLGAAAYSVLVYALTIIALSAVFGVFLYLASRFLVRGNPLAPLQLGVSWVLMEMICELLRLPFTPVLALTQTPTLLQTAELGGQHFVSFLLVLFQGSVVTALRSDSARERVVSAWGVVLAVAVTAGYAISNTSDSSRTDAERLKAAVVQTDVHPVFTENWKADGQQEILARMRAASYTELLNLEPAPELVVWPEVWFAGLEMRRGIYSGGASRGAAMLLGAPDVDEHGRRINAVFSVAADGRVLHRHGKRVLLPLLEDSYAPGFESEPHRFVVGTPGSLICFESAFSSVARELTLAGARLLAISTSDAYAGPSFLAFMHHDLARIRAVENRRTILRAANGGPSSIILPSGEIRKRLGLFENGVLALDVPLVERITLYTRFADWWRLGWIGMLGFAVWGAYRNRRAVPQRPAAVALPVAGLVALLAAAGLVAFQVRYVVSLYHSAKPSSGGAAYSLGFRKTLGDLDWRYDELTVGELGDTRYAALAYLLREHGVPTSTAALLDLAETLPQGRAELDALAGKYGFATRIEEHTPTRVSSLATPALVELRSGETVVLQRLDQERADFFSPLRGEHVAITREAFVEAWRGATLGLEGTPLE